MTSEQHQGKRALANRRTSPESALNSTHDANIVVAGVSFIAFSLSEFLLTLQATNPLSLGWQLSTMIAIVQ
ncbi:hypothetical protein CGL57_14650 [Edwardsiella anguillarum]|nr:hypothetical protein QY76_14370 [Edwardsiella sp. EA181011]RFT01941.1 hypothetical protein CGL57_14650 [Edwardsiella anguillarum]